MTWLVDPLVREPEGAPVKAKSRSGVQNAQRPHRILRIHVMRRHEPAGFVGADGQKGNVEARMPGCNGLKVPAATQPGIAGKIDRMTATAHHKGGPERMIAVVGGPGGPMMSRFNERLKTGSECNAFAPIQRCHGDACVMSPDDGVVAERGHDLRLIASPEPHKGRQVEVIVVVVRDEHRIDPGQPVEWDTWRIVPPWSCKRHGAGALGPDRVREDVVAGNLDQEGRVADEADAQITFPDLRWWRVLERTWVNLGPGHRPFGELPMEEVDEAAGAFSAGVEEAPSIEVVAQRAFVIKSALGGSGLRCGAKEWERPDQLYEPSAR